MRDYERLREQDRRDAEWLARIISAPLHYTTKKRQCQDPTRCDMCSNAGRLAVQSLRPVIEKRMVERLVTEYDAGCRMPHPGGD